MFLFLLYVVTVRQAEHGDVPPQYTHLVTQIQPHSLVEGLKCKESPGRATLRVNTKNVSNLTFTIKFYTQQCP